MGNKLNRAKLNFRRATPGDLKELNRISIRSKSHWGYPKQWIEQWRDELTLTREDLESMLVTVVETQSNILGFCAVKEWERTNEIMHLWILPDYIGYGIGTELLGFVLKTEMTEDKPFMVISDPNAEAFYKKFGFETIDLKESYPKGRFLPVMRKLTSSV